MATQLIVERQAASSDAKSTWMRKMKEVIQESYLSSALPNVSLDPPKSPLKMRPGSQRTSR